MNESEIKVKEEWKTPAIEWKSLTESIVNRHADQIETLEGRVITLERALEALLKKEEMSKLNLSGGDGEWY